MKNRNYNILIFSFKLKKYIFYLNLSFLNFNIYKKYIFIINNYNNKLIYIILYYIIIILNYIII